uniref:Uncharacterized protein n=1 Tax=Rhizophora mucronata TaxID=61149 RepID=A0A2P2PG35_RHIMU
MICLIYRVLISLNMVSQIFFLKVMDFYLPKVMDFLVISFHICTFVIKQPFSFVYLPMSL